MYDIAKDLCSIEYELYGQYAETYVKINDVRITNISELKKAYHELDVEDNIYEIMMQQFLNHRITKPIILNCFYNNMSVEFNRIYVDWRNFECQDFYVCVRGSNITSSISNSVIMGMIDDEAFTTTLS